jgi:hypothetical protein
MHSGLGDPGTENSRPCGISAAAGKSRVTGQHDSVYTNGGVVDARVEQKYD